MTFNEWWEKEGKKIRKGSPYDTAKKAWYAALDQMISANLARLPEGDRREPSSPREHQGS